MLDFYTVFAIEWCLIDQFDDLNQEKESGDLCTRPVSYRLLNILRHLPFFLSQSETEENRTNVLLGRKRTKWCWWHHLNTSLRNRSVHSTSLGDVKFVVAQKNSLHLFSSLRLRTEKKSNPLVSISKRRSIGNCMSNSPFFPGACGKETSVKFDRGKRPIVRIEIDELKLRFVDARRSPNMSNKVTNAHRSIWILFVSRLNLSYIHHCLRHLITNAISVL